MSVRVAMRGALLTTLTTALGCQAHAPDGGETAPHEQVHTDGALPSAFKGYELYAWDDGGALAFTLITGTNRLKTVEEITGTREQAATEGWVVVRGHGVEELKLTLMRVPVDTSVVLHQLEGLAPISDEQRVEVTELVASR